MERILRVARRQSLNTLFSLKCKATQAHCFPEAELEGAMRAEGPGAETELMLRGYGLTTAELYYRMPDFRHVLNSFIWQEYDLAPDYPELFRFIENRHPALFTLILQKKQIDDEVKGKLTAVLDEFKGTFTA